jgi:hypothetical protein
MGALSSTSNISDIARALDFDQAVFAVGVAWEVEQHELAKAQRHQ